MRTLILALLVVLIGSSASAKDAKQVCFNEVALDMVMSGQVRGNIAKYRQVVEDKSNLTCFPATQVIRRALLQKKSTHANIYLKHLFLKDQDEK